MGSRKPKSYWTKKTCLNEALKYKNRTRWFKGHQSSYQIARVNGWLDYCSKHMEKDVDRKPKGYWTKDKLIEESLKYNTKTEWSNASSGSFSRAYTLGIEAELTAHMDRNYPKIKKEECFTYARRCKSKHEFRVKHQRFYSKAMSYGWYDTICELNSWEYTPQMPWTKEYILESTKDYTNLKDWVRDNHHRTKLMAKRLGVFNKCVKLIKKNAIKKHNNLVKSILNSTKKYTSYDTWCLTQPRFFEMSKRYLIRTKIRDSIIKNKRELKRNGM